MKTTRDLIKEKRGFQGTRDLIKEERGI